MGVAGCIVWFFPGACDLHGNESSLMEYVLLPQVCSSGGVHGGADVVSDDASANDPYPNASPDPSACSRPEDDWAKHVLTEHGYPHLFADEHSNPSASNELLESVEHSGQWHRIGVSTTCAQKMDDLCSLALKLANKKPLPSTKSASCSSFSLHRRVQEDRIAERDHEKRVDLIVTFSGCSKMAEHILIAIC